VQKITLLLADHPFPPHTGRWLVHRRGFDFGGCPVSYSPNLFQRLMISGESWTAYAEAEANYVAGAPRITNIFSY
jgi:hypothetical protein